MQHTLVVGALECARQLVRDVEGLGDGECSALQPVGQVLALDELHDQEPRAAGFLVAVDRGDVAVVQRGQQFGLALTARAES